MQALGHETGLPDLVVLPGLQLGLAQVPGIANMAGFP